MKKGLLLFVVMVMVMFVSSASSWAGIGVRPTDRAVAEIVQAIQEKYGLKDPNLVYPGEKFILKDFKGIYRFNVRINHFPPGEEDNLWAAVKRSGSSGAAMPYERGLRYLRFAAARGETLDLGGWETFRSWYRSLDQYQDKAELMHFWLLGAGDSYQDFFQPGFAGLILIYDQEIRQSQNDEQRFALTKEMVDQAHQTLVEVSSKASANGEVDFGDAENTVLLKLQLALDDRNVLGEGEYGKVLAELTATDLFCRINDFRGDL